MSDYTPCSVDGCDRKAICRTYCSSHYARWRHGRTLDEPFVKPKRLKQSCSIDGCGTTEFASGLCQHHYRRSRKYGDPNIGPDPVPKYETIEERFWSKVNRSGADECWEWTAGTYRTGYGLFNIRKNGRRATVGAHRFAYMSVNGVSLPSSIDVDHMCHNPMCCNPSHLRAVTRKQNAENRKGAQSNSKSGVRGVWWVEKHQKWEAVVMDRRRRVYCGLYDRIEDAEDAVTAKRAELFTPNPMDRKSA